MYFIQIAESKSHKDEVKNRLLSQRITRLIQTGQYIPLKQQNLEPVIKAKPIGISTAKTKPGDYLNITYHSLQTLIDDRVTFDETHELHSFASMFKVTKRKEANLQVIEPVMVRTEDSRHKLCMSASGIDLESQVVDRTVSLDSLFHPPYLLTTSI